MIYKWLQWEKVKAEITKINVCPSLIIISIVKAAL